MCRCSLSFNRLCRFKSEPHLKCEVFKILFQHRDKDPKFIRERHDSHLNSSQFKSNLSNYMVKWTNTSDILRWYCWNQLWKKEHLHFVVNTDEYGERERERRGTVVFNNRVVKLFWENVTQLVDKLHALLCQSYFSTTFVWMCITLHYFSFLLLTYLCYYQILLSHSQIKHKRIIGCFIRATNYIKLLTLNKVYMLKV